MGVDSNKDYERFTWKSDGKIFKGVGVYHLTFVVADRKKLLGTVRGVDMATVKRSSDMNATALNPEERAAYVSERQKLAWVDFTPYGKAVDDVLRHYDEEHDGIKVCVRKVLDDHFHVARRYTNARCKMTIMKHVISNSNGKKREVLELLAITEIPENAPSTQGG